VDDLIDGIVRWFAGGDHDPVNIGNPVEFTIRELADLVVRLTGSRAAVTHAPLPTDDPKQRRPDITRVKTIVGWEPAVPLEDGLRRSIPYFRAQLAA
jgi:nucleoside-diphosphate-sugar epimerase